MLIDHYRHGVLQDTEFKKANKDELRAVFKYLEFCLQQVVKDNELGALQQVCSTCLPAAVRCAGSGLSVSRCAMLCDRLLALNCVMLLCVLFQPPALKCDRLLGLNRAVLCFVTGS